MSCLKTQNEISFTDYGVLCKISADTVPAPINKNKQQPQTMPLKLHSLVSAFMNLKPNQMFNTQRFNEKRTRVHVFDYSLPTIRREGQCNHVSDGVAVDVQPRHANVQLHTRHEKFEVSSCLV